MSKILKLFSFSIFLLIIAFAFNSKSYAQDDDSLTANTTVTASPTTMKDKLDSIKLDRKEKVEARISERAQKKEERLSEARLKICEARSSVIKGRLKSLNARAKIIHEGHEKIYLRVDKFYNEKLVANGYKLSNYDTLKKNVEDNKAKVIALHSALKDTGEGFDCNSDDPKGEVDAFKEDMKELILANKAYKDSIHVFVKAVRDLAKTAKLEKISVTPVPTMIPSVTPEEVNQ